MATITVTPIKTFVSGETVTPAKLNQLSQSTVALTAATIVAADIASDAVITAKILNDNVTNAKLASGIDASKLTTGTLPIARIANETIDTAKLVDEAVTAAKLQAGVTLQTVYAERVEQLTVGVPYDIDSDDTKPQNTEGVEVLTASITPSQSTNKVLIQACLNGAWAGSGTIVVALFRGTTSNALSTVWQSATAATNGQLLLAFQDSPSATTATSYKIRVGYVVGGSGYYVNGSATGQARFGGTLASWITLTEIKA